MLGGMGRGLVRSVRRSSRDVERFNERRVPLDGSLRKSDLFTIQKQVYFVSQKKDIFVSFLLFGLWKNWPRVTIRLQKIYWNAEH